MAENKLNKSKQSNKICLNYRLSNSNTCCAIAGSPYYIGVNILVTDLILHYFDWDPLKARLCLFFRGAQRLSTPLGALKKLT